MLYGSIGACIAGIPLVLLLIYQSCSNTGLKQQIDNYKELEAQGLYLHVWMLNKDISAGEKVRKANLVKKKVWISEKDFIDHMTDIHQIVGKKAKTALKKGTIVQADLLYQKKHIDDISKKISK